MTCISLIQNLRSWRWLSNIFVVLLRSFDINLRLLGERINGCLVNLLELTWFNSFFRSMRVCQWIHTATVCRVKSCLLNSCCKCPGARQILLLLLLHKSTRIYFQFVVFDWKRYKVWWNGLLAIILRVLSWNSNMTADNLSLSVNCLRQSLKFSPNLVDHLNYGLRFSTLTSVCFLVVPLDSWLIWRWRKL